MRNTAISAMLFGAALAGTHRHFSKKYAFMDRLKTMVKRSAEEHPMNVLPPDSDCFSWYEDNEKCDGQWERWDAQCERRWKIECERVQDQWYESDIEFLEP